MKIVYRLYRVFRGRMGQEHFFDVRQNAEFGDTRGKGAAKIVQGPWGDAGALVELYLALAETIERLLFAAAEKYETLFRQ